MDEATAHTLSEKKAEGEFGHAVTCRDHLPTLPEDCEYEAYYVEEHIMGSAGNMLNLTHSGLVLKRKSNDTTAAAPTAMTFQYFGLTGQARSQSNPNRGQALAL